MLEQSKSDCLQWGQYTAMAMEISNSGYPWSRVKLVCSYCISFLLLTEYLSMVMAAGSTQTGAAGSHLARSNEGGSSSLVLTPGGYRHPSLVHRLQDRGRVTSELESTRTKAFASLPADLASPGRAVNESGWIQDASFLPSNASALYFFSTIWTVPPPPSSKSNQTIFLFNSFWQEYESILQPVLQWGPSAAGGGQSWYVTSWYVSEFVVLHKDLVPVHEGDTLKGVMFLTGKSGTGYDYVSFFEGMPPTVLRVSNVSKLTAATETLECYNIDQCSDYPNTSDTSMSDIYMKTVGVSLAANGSSLNAYVGSDNSQHVNYIDSIGHIHELYMYPDVQAWVNNDLIDFAGGEPGASDSSLAGYWGSDKSQHVIYVDDNGHLHELNIGPGPRWANNDLTAFTNGTSAAPGSSISGYWGSDNTQHIYFFDTMGHVHELYSSQPGAQWVDNDLTSLSGGTPARNGNGLDAYQGSDKSQHVNFIDTKGHIHELSFSLSASTWTDNDLTASSNGSTAASDSYLSAYWANDSSQHVYFIDENHDVHQLSTHPDAPWSDDNLSMLAKSGAKARSSSRLNGYWGANSSPHVTYIDEDGHVHEIYFLKSEATWVDDDITTNIRNRECLLAAPGTGLDSYLGHNGQHINFVSVDHHVYELSMKQDQISGSSWAVNDLGAAGGVDIPISWKVDNRSSQCGEQTVIISDMNPGGTVELWYGRQ